MIIKETHRFLMVFGGLKQFGVCFPWIVQSRKQGISTHHRKMQGFFSIT